MPRRGWMIAGGITVLFCMVCTATFSVYILRRSFPSLQVRQSAYPRLPEEKVAVNLLNAWFKDVEVLEWGPHDLGGRLADKVARRKAKGWTEISSHLGAQLRPETMILRVKFRHLDGKPRVDCVLMCFWEGKPFKVKNILNDEPSEFYGSISGFGESWLEDELAKLD